ncbi:hypothetical protein [Natronococcus sp.]|uniref:hypothetical protein n=1 Tax=Natronococcus sp. TaxID=35747 RepID=UPI0025E83D27|nr:hypothetical protein [Natronococcus sp.]
MQRRYSVSAYPAAWRTNRGTRSPFRTTDRSREPILLGLSSFGLAGLTAANQPVTQLEFRERRLEEADFEPLRRGVLDGVPAGFTTRSLDVELPPHGTPVTPIHPPEPEFDAAVRFLKFLREGTHLEVDDRQLRERSESMSRDYDELTDRIETLESERERARRNAS